MTEWLMSLPGTETGKQLAIVCALVSAFMHALFGSMQKGRMDPWISRGAFDFWMAVLAAPVALFVVPWPDAQTFLILAGAMVIHFFYKLTMTLAYVRAPYTTVYPVVRGTSPVITVIAASIFFAESYSATQWLGIAFVSGGILALSALNIARGETARGPLLSGLAIAFLCGLFVAAYTTWDAWGIRTAQTPFVFLAWFFFLSSLDFPIISYLRWRRAEAPPRAARIMRNGFFGALVAFVSFGGVMLATYLDKVGEAAVLRETSTVFAAIIGWIFLKEAVGPGRAALMVLIAAGAIIVEFG
ncbi:Arginine/ornithine antiporter ArcD [Candidatus Rhodobacter oscarellae]|uniref:Arginine/ornithine antiporter ArcD n=1 Tax=Candidatus Rhodobacter oscarellae TaxID=1675527 RepID=A0A0J9GSP5_9RHOB|nr:DMT family transporter [Candidatus Rhodobacter lobularis]KMW56518.1 Arginine/ornithine antiporter ArcD [Candidatus Rhodobacter lobularis]